MTTIFRIKNKRTLQENSTQRHARFFAKVSKGTRYVHMSESHGTRVSPSEERNPQLLIKHHNEIHGIVS